MTSNDETGEVTGTKDKLYNLIWFTEQSLSNALRLETYIQDAERDGDTEVADLFRRAQAESRKGGELGKSPPGGRPQKKATLAPQVILAERRTAAGTRWGRGVARRTAG